ncbi:MAG: VapE family protein [Microscillaceae bacterium]|nr:VapE family protein [Microscillaceae bacterium]
MQELSEETPHQEILERIQELLLEMSKNQLENLEKQLRKKPVVEIVEQYLDTHYEIRSNTVAHCFEYRRKQSHEPFEQLNEDELFRELQKKKIFFGLNSLRSLLRSKFVSQYDPIRAYFERLEHWQQGRDEDHIDKLASYVKARDPDRFRYHFKKHLVRAVACVMLPQVYNKHCLVLIGRQNDGKSSFCRFLSPPALRDYYAENIGTDKDSLIALTENFWINLDELSTLSRSDINALKSVFSKDIVKVRRPYDSKTTSTHRIASFLGSTDRYEFLSDEAGSVRWLCFEEEGIDFNYTQDCDINQVYAQAYQLFKDGFKYDLSRQDIEESENVNREYQITTPEMDLLQRYYQPGNPENPADFMTATEVTTELVRASENKVKILPRDVGKALKFLGYPKGQLRKAGTFPIKGYYIQRIDSLSNYEKDNHSPIPEKQEVPF